MAARRWWSRQPYLSLVTRAARYDWQTRKSAKIRLMKTSGKFRRMGLAAFLLIDEIVYKRCFLVYAFIG